MTNTALRKLLCLAAASLSPMAHADVAVGVVLSTTGPAASLGIPEKNTFALLPRTAGKQRINYIVYDDASDTTAAIKITRKLIAEHRVDVLIGSTITPNSLAMVDLAAEAGIPLISLAASTRIVEPVDDKRAWAFKTPQSDAQMAETLVEHMSRNHVKTVAFIGFSDAYGEGWWNKFSEKAGKKNLRVLAEERYNRTDTTIAEPIARIVAAAPDAVLIAASGTPAVLPHKALRAKGYKGTVYQTHGVANGDFLRICGRACEGTYLPAGPVLVAAQLPANNPLRASGMDYIARYEAVHGKGSVSAFGAHAWDAGMLLVNAMPQALNKASPGSSAFRKALRDALENTTDLPATHGVFNLNAQDHHGLDRRSRVMVKIEGGRWKLVP